jgi:hypothetical protein
MINPVTTLQLTSCLFGTVVVHAYAKREALLHLLCLIQTVLSVWNHSSKNATVRSVDMFFARVLFCYGSFQLAYTMNPFFVFSLALAVLWVAECRLVECEETATKVHAVLHVVACVGMHGYLWYYG